MLFSYPSGLSLPPWACTYYLRDYYLSAEEQPHVTSSMIRFNFVLGDYILCFESRHFKYSLWFSLCTSSSKQMCWFCIISKHPQCRQPLWTSGNPDLIGTHALWRSQTAQGLCSSGWRDEILWVWAKCGGNLSTSECKEEQLCSGRARQTLWRPY